MIMNHLISVNHARWGKMTQTLFSEKGDTVADILGLVHTDVYGQMSKDAKSGFSYFIIFTYDHSRYGFICLMEFKSEALEKFKEFKQEVERQIEKKYSNTQI